MPPIDARRISDVFARLNTQSAGAATLLVVAGLALALSQAPAVFKTWTPEALILPGPAALIAAIALVGLALVPVRLRRSAALLVALLTLITLTSLAAGVASLLMAGACAATGTLLLPADQPRSPAALAAASIVGLGMLLGFFWMLLPFPINRPWVYAVILTIPIAVRGRELLGWLEALVSVEKIEREGRIEVWAHFLAVAAVVAAVAGSLYPVILPDDVGYHIRLENQLLHYGRYTFDIKFYSWAVAPFGSDLVYAIAFVTSGGDQGTHTAIHAFLSIAIAVLLWDLARQTTNRTFSWFTLAIFFSAPIVHFLNHSMQTELVLASFALAGFWLIFRSSSSLLLPVAVACGALLAIKTSGATLAVGLAALALWRSFRRGELNPIGLVEGGAMGLAIALPSYVWAYKLTGNPFFPLFDRMFQGAVVFDPSYSGHLKWTFLFDLYADTSRFMETPQRGASDASLLILAPAGILIGIVQGPPLVRAALGVAAVYETVILSQIQYVRYLFPAMPLVFVATANVLRVLAGSMSTGRKLAVAAISTVTVGLNLAVVGRGGWAVLNQNVWRIATDPEHRNEYIAIGEAPRLLAKPINSLLGKDDKVLLFGSEAASDFAVPTLIDTPWYAPEVSDALARARDPADAVRFLRRFHVSHVLIGTKRFAFEEPMLSLTRKFGVPVVSRYGYSLYDVSRFRYGTDDDVTQFFAKSAGEASKDAKPLPVAGGALTEGKWERQGDPKSVSQEAALRVDSQNLVRSETFRVLAGYRYILQLVARCDRDGSFVINVGFEGASSFVGSDFRLSPCSDRYEAQSIPMQVPFGAIRGRFELTSRPGERPATIQRAELFAVHD